jgi:hypothetical protein
VVSSSSSSDCCFFVSGRLKVSESVKWLPHLAPNKELPQWNTSLSLEELSVALEKESPSPGWGFWTFFFFTFPQILPCGQQSIGRLLKSCGLRTTSIKIDPYLNCDAGTMSPFEHGECFVLDDGGETDLDLVWFRTPYN